MLYLYYIDPSKNYTKSAFKNQDTRVVSSNYGVAVVVCLL